MWSIPDIPEAGNGVNDLLDEARKNIEWMLSMQVPDGTKMMLPVGKQEEGKPLTLTEVDASGMVHHKVHDEVWTSGATMPHQAKETRYLYPPSTGATLNVAAIGAQCARVFKAVDKQFAKECLETSQKALEAARRNSNIFGYNNFDGGGPYGDRNYRDEFVWADIELKLLTQMNGYEDQLENEIPLSMGFNQTYMQGRVSNAMTPIGSRMDKKPALKLRSGTQDLRIYSHTSAQIILETADNYVTDTAKEKLHIPFYAESYKWGGNSNLANRAIVLGTAYQLTGERKYRDGVVHLMDYLLGRNPMGVSYITGYGDKPFKNPHHRFWAKQLDETRPEPPAGVLSGGPNNDNMSDPVAETMIGTCAPQTCWVDDHGAWTLNEVTINWNAPLFWMAAFLDATEE